MKRNLEIQRFSIFFLLIIILACNNSQPQNPTIYSNDGFLDYSKKFNKELNQLENEQIQDYIQKQKVEFYSTDAGIHMTKTELKAVNTVEEKDTIWFQYGVKNLKDSIIYTKEEIGKKAVVLGQYSMIRGLEFGLKRMIEGEEATLLIPSSLAYGVKGDGNKIGADQPLVINIKLNKLRKNEK